MCVLCCLFFFFKQKTAYEMRISDWSSDVCSSDLVVMAGRLVETELQVDRRQREFGRLDGAALQGIEGVAAGQRHGIDAKLRDDPGADDHEEIGRASCREGVCQYV